MYSYIRIYIATCAFIHIDLLFIHICLYVGLNISEQCLLMVNGKNQVRGMTAMYINKSNFVLHVRICSELVTDEFSYNTYKAYLQYLYTDSVNMSPEEAVGKFVHNTLFYLLCKLVTAYIAKVNRKAL